ncbi:MAG: hypothetical protein HFH41_08780 [Lachnospiraceae bacterium]|nr:hypothetical protein [Lachnospiraceae bacterium]
MAAYEFFKKEFEFRGKHARMVSELCTLNDYQHTYFKRAIDVYVLAAVVGFRVDRKAEADYAPNESKSIFSEQMLGAKEDLDFLMQMMVMLENEDNVSLEERVKKAFRGAETQEEFEHYRDLFHSYVRGGVEELYERLVLRKAEVEEFYDEKTANLMELLERFSIPEEPMTR